LAKLDPEAARRLLETGEKQIPWETSSLTGDFCFRAG